MLRHLRVSTSEVGTNRSENPFDAIAVILPFPFRGSFAPKDEIQPRQGLEPSG